MAPAGELSSNWKILQARLKAGQQQQPSAAKKETEPKQHNHAKRKATDDNAGKDSGAKKQKPNAPPVKKDGANKKQRQWPVRQPSQSSSAQKSGRMGVTQSSAHPKGTSATVKPSLALWAEENDISAEALAEAYDLGVKNNAMLKVGSSTSTAEEKHRVNEGLPPGLKISDVGKYIGLDCEMVGIGPDGYDHALARVSVVDFHGKQVYDSFVRPREKVTDWRTSITGITPKIAKTGRDFDEVQKVIAELLKDRILVGHDIRHDLAVLVLDHPTPQIRDTARFSGYRKYGHGPKPALRVLAKEVLGVEIQGGHHSSVEDARVAMLLFRKRKSEFDVEHAHKFSKFIKDDGSGDEMGRAKSKGVPARKNNNKKRR